MEAKFEAPVLRTVTIKMDELQADILRKLAGNLSGERMSDMIYQQHGPKECAAFLDELYTTLENLLHQEGM